MFQWNWTEVELHVRNEAKGQKYADIIKHEKEQPLTNQERERVSAKLGEMQFGKAKKSESRGSGYPLNICRDKADKNGTDVWPNVSFPGPTNMKGDDRLFASFPFSWLPVFITEKKKEHTRRKDQGLEDFFRSLCTE